MCQYKFKQTLLLYIYKPVFFVRMVLSKQLIIIKR